jgi:hypothetical protein
MGKRLVSAGLWRTPAGPQDRQVVLDVLAGRDSLSVQRCRLSRVKSPSLDPHVPALQVALDRQGYGLVRASLDLSLASGVIAVPDIPRLALLS